MKMFYLPETPFGEFFYDPKSCQGVAISESGLVILNMASDFNPAMQSGYIGCEVADDTFSNLIDTVSRYTSGERDIRDILKAFPRTNHASSGF